MKNNKYPNRNLSTHRDHRIPVEELQGIDLEIKNELSFKNKKNAKNVPLIMESPLK